jgi:hypothetical protein
MGLWPRRLGSFSAGLPLPERRASNRGYQPPRCLSLKRRIGRSPIRSLSSRTHPLPPEIVITKAPSAE